MYIYRNYKNHCFSERGVKIAVKVLIDNCHLRVGQRVLRQAIGIPMRNYEENFISDMIQSDKVRARHFHTCMRFIDDLLGLNDGGEFARSSGQIYPSDLELKRNIQAFMPHF